MQDLLERRIERRPHTTVSQPRALETDSSVSIGADGLPHRGKYFSTVDLNAKLRLSRGELAPQYEVNDCLLRIAAVAVLAREANMPAQMVDPDIIAQVGRLHAAYPDKGQEDQLASATRIALEILTYNPKVHENGPAALFYKSASVRLRGHSDIRERATSETVAA